MATSSSPSRAMAASASCARWRRDCRPRSRRTGYKLVRVPLRDGKPTGEYEDFMTGFVTPEGNIWARPVGITVAADGALLMSDDAGGTISRISYVGDAR